MQKKFKKTGQHQQSYGLQRCDSSQRGSVYNVFRKQMPPYVEEVFQWQYSRCRTNYHEEHWTTVDPDIPGDTYAIANKASGQTNGMFVFHALHTLVQRYKH